MSLNRSEGEFDFVFIAYLILILIVHYYGDVMLYEISQERQRSRGLPCGWKTWQILAFVKYNWQNIYIIHKINSTSLEWIFVENLSKQLKAIRPMKLLSRARGYKLTQFRDFFWRSRKFIPAKYNFCGSYRNIDQKSPKMASK